MNPLVAHQPQSHRKQSSTSSLKYEPGPSSEHRRKEPEHQQGEPTPFFLSYTQVYHQSTHWRGNSTPSLTKQIKLGTKHVIWPGRSSSLPSASNNSNLTQRLETRAIDDCVLCWGHSLINTAGAGEALDAIVSYKTNSSLTRQKSSSLILRCRLWLPQRKRQNASASSKYKIEIINRDDLGEWWSCGGLRRLKWFMSVGQIQPQLQAEIWKN